MKFALSYLITSALVPFLTACSISTPSSPADSLKFGGPQGEADARALPENPGPLTGTVDQLGWKIGKGIAEFKNGEYAITLAGEGVNLSCGNRFPDAALVLFDVTGEKANYFYDGSADGRLVNVFLPTTKGSENILASKSQINIDGITAGVMKGSLAALSAIDSARTYRLAGTFTAEVCNGPAVLQELQITTSASSFKPVFLEAYRFGDSSYQIRVADHAPETACDPDFEYRNMTSIRHAILNVPKTLGSFTITTGTLTYSSYGPSSGWGTEYFTGTATVQLTSPKTLSLSIDAVAAYANGPTVKGATQVTICN